jgi:hypothetical protein
MTDKRRLRSLKQARRDVWRAKKRNSNNQSVTAAGTDLIRRAVSCGHPLGLLHLVSQLIHLSKPDRLAFLKSVRHDPLPLDRIVSVLIGVRNRDTTAVLAVVAELLVDEPELQTQCRQELAERRERLPRWIADLPRIDVYRAVRRTDVFGDADELILGARLDDRYELTIGVLIDHNRFSGITDGDADRIPIDEALAWMTETSPELEVVEMSPADARRWIEDAFAQPTFARDTNGWPLYEPLVRWLVSRLPEGGERRSPAMDWQAAEELCDAFFASDSSAQFDRAVYREQLLELFETGTEDPLRWSEIRVRDVMRNPSYCDDGTPLEVTLDVPDLLRAFIPYAHAQSGIGDELTSRTLAVIDELRSSYRHEILTEARELWGYDEAG